MSAENINWFVLRVTPQMELRAELALKDLGYQSFTPIEWKWKRVKANSNRRRRWAYPMFIRYSFVGTSKHWKAAHHHMADHVEYYQGMLGYRNDIGEIVAAPLRRSEVEDLQAMSGESIRYVGSINPHKAALQPKVGGKAQIIEGPFSGRTVKVTEIRNHKAKVMLDMFNSMPVAVTVGMEQLEAV